MATLTVTAALLGSYSSKVTEMTVNGADRYHILHGLGATPHEFIFTLRSHPNISLPLQYVLGSYDATMLFVSASSGGVSGRRGALDIVIRRTHSLAI